MALYKFRIIIIIIIIYGIVYQLQLSVQTMLTHLKINRLDRFWTNQELIYDYKSSLTGIGNRSTVDNFDDTIFSFIIMSCTFDRHMRLQSMPFFSALLNCSICFAVLIS